jgi:ClpP class serine protease
MPDNNQNPNQKTKLNLGFLAERIINTPLLITQAKLDQIISVVGDRIGLDTSLVVTQQPAASRSSSKEYYTSKGVAVIPIYGTLVHRVRGLSALSGITSYENIRAQFDDALSSKDVDSILFDIDSPGGEVAGVFDLVDHIYSSRGTKPIVAVSNERAHSAAYAIASAADYRYLTRTAGMGSIGVVMIHVDKSEANKRAGISYTYMYAGDKKIDGSPNSPLSDSARADAQATIDSMYSLFVATVARNTGLSEKTIINTQAGTYHGQSAVDIGLANAILPYQEVVNNLVNQKGGIFTAMPNEKQNTKLETPETPNTEEQTPTPALETPEQNPPQTPTPPTSPALDQAALDAAITAERTRCTEIMEACTIANVKDLAPDLIADGSTIETAHKMIMTMLSERSKAQSVQSSLNPLPAGGENPLIKNAKARRDAILGQGR